MARLAKVIGRPDWVKDVSLKTAEARRDSEDLIEQAIEAWTITRDADQAMSELQAATIAAGVARLPIDLLSDRHLRSRGYLQEAERAFIGWHPQPSMPIREQRRYRQSDKSILHRRLRNPPIGSPANPFG